MCPLYFVIVFSLFVVGGGFLFACFLLFLCVCFFSLCCFSLFGHKIRQADRELSLKY